jgi:hypothetical protein
MATQILRTVDRWRFETPLAIALAAASGFATLAMPHELFARLPVVGHRGMPAHIALALVLAIVCGVAGYLAMRRPKTVVPVDEDADLLDDIDAPSGLSEDRLVRLRRADRHPDAPPREPIRASRDLGEPFMDVGASVPKAEPDTTAEAVAAEPAIIDGDYVELEEVVKSPAATPFAAASAENAAPAFVRAERHALGEPFVAPSVDETPVEQTPVAAAPVEASAVEAPVSGSAAPIPAATPAAAPAPRLDASIAAMTERLSAGMERRRAGRSTMPVRDMRPALRDALDELNRLAARHG